MMLFVDGLAKVAFVILALIVAVCAVELLLRQNAVDEADELDDEDTAVRQASYVWDDECGTCGWGMYNHRPGCPEGDVPEGWIPDFDEFDEDDDYDDEEEDRTSQ